MIDVIQRYRPVIQIINRLDIQELLEIGSSSYGIIRFYEGKVIGLDIQFEDEREIAENLIPVLGSACLLPFKDGCFEAVVCVHMLEHIPSKARSSAIREMLRVSKKYIVLSVPCGKKSELYEEKLNRFHSLFFKDRGWLKEHEKYGLPEKEKIIEEIYNSNPNVIVEVLGNVNLAIWLITMIVQLPFDTIFWKYAPTKRNAVLKILMKMTGWIMPIFDFKDTYSQIFIIKRI